MRSLKLIVMVLSKKCKEYLQDEYVSYMLWGITLNYTCLFTDLHLFCWPKHLNQLIFVFYYTKKCLHIMDASSNCENNSQISFHAVKQLQGGLWILIPFFLISLISLGFLPASLPLREFSLCLLALVSSCKEITISYWRAFLFHFPYCFLSPNYIFFAI